MLNERFLSQLSASFGGFYEKVDAEARDDARRLLADARGDAKLALARARFTSAARVWWPYVQGSLPLIGKADPAAQAFTRVVLTVNHLVGHHPASMEDARNQVVHVLRDSLDIERLRRIVDRDGGKDAAQTVATTGLVATATALLSPFTMIRQVRGAIKWVPPAARIAVGGVVLAALLSVPMVAGYSAGVRAERSARGASTAGTSANGDTAAARPSRAKPAVTA